VFNFPPGSGLRVRVFQMRVEDWGSAALELRVRGLQHFGLGLRVRGVQHVGLGLRVTGVQHLGGKMVSNVESWFGM
jgi:hypothetical protein